MKKKAQGDVVLRDKHNHLNLVLIVGMAISGSRGGKTLDMGTLDINNQNCIRKEHILEGVASEGVLSRAGCLAALD